MRTFKLYDRDEEAYVLNEDGTEFVTDSFEEADELKCQFIREGLYPHFFPSILGIHEFNNGVFIGEAIYLILN